MRTSTLAALCLLFSWGCASQSSRRPEHWAGCAAPAPGKGDGGTNQPTLTPSATGSPTSSIMQITAGSTVFTATLCDNATAAAFEAMLPLSVNMVDLHANEKYYDLPRALPARPTNPGTIHTGDVMLYGSNTLVLFYKTFTTSYSYTPIAKVEDPSRLAAALGTDNVTVSFSR